MPSRSTVDALLLRLFEAPASEWPQKLEALCAEQPECEAELRRRHGLLADTGLDQEPPTEDTAAALHDRFGDFRLLRQLGSGGMGMVFVAYQQSLGREVALKIVRPDLVFSPDARQRFRREIEAIAQLEHPAIVPVLTHGQHGDVQFYVMPLLPGRSCDAVIQRLQDRPPASLTGNDLRRAIHEDALGSDGADQFAGAYWMACVRLLRQTALGLDHAHRHGVIHRDVKPSNVLLTPDGRAVLLDFGLAHVRDDPRITRTGAAPGSPAYMAPEQVRGRTADERSDVYALAATLHHLLALAPPFPLDELAQLHNRILAGRRETLNERVVPRDLVVVLAAAMDVDPDRRHRSALAFAADLGAVLERRPILARTLPVSLRLLRWLQRHPTVGTSVGALLLLLFGVPTLFAFGLAAERDRAREAEAIAGSHAYESSIAAASAALRTGDGEEARRRLASCPESLRRLEWHHLHRSLSGSVARFADHTGPIAAIAVRGDGVEVAAGDGDGRVVVWRRDTPANRRELMLPAGAAVCGLEWVAADRLAVVRGAGAEGELLLVDVPTGTLVARRETSIHQHICLGDAGSCVLLCEDFTVTELDPGTLAPRRSIALAPVGIPPEPPFATDGVWLFAATLHNVRAWHLHTGEHQSLHAELVGHVTDVAAGGARAAFATALGVFVADVSPLRLRAIDTGTRPCAHVAIDPRGAFVAAVGVGDCIRVWDADTARAVSQTSGTGVGGRAVAIAPQRLLAAVGDQSGAVQMFSLFGGSERQTLKGHAGSVCQLAVAPSGELLSAAQEPSLRSWDSVTGRPLAANYAAMHWINAMVVGDDARHVYTAWRTTVARHRLPDLAVGREIDVGSWVQHLLPLAGERILVVATERVAVCDFVTGDLQVVERHDRRTASAAAVAIRARTGFLATASRVDRWTLLQPPRLERSFAVEGQVAAMAVDPNGEQVYCAESRMLRCRRAADGQVEWERPCGRAVTALLLLAAEPRLVAGHDDGSVSLFEPASGRCVATLQAGGAPVRALAAPAGGDWLAAADEWATITLFRGAAADGDPDAGLARADVVAAAWLDEGLRRQLILQSRVLDAVAQRTDLAPELRAAMTAAERLRPPSNWESMSGLLLRCMRPDQPARFYRLALEIAESAPDPLGFVGPIAAFACLRLGRLDAALAHCDTALARPARQPGLRTLAQACRVLALTGLGRVAEADADIAALRQVLADERDPDTIQVLREAMRAVPR